jgi:hypothetical protein
VIFNYQWTAKENANYAIQKRDMKNKKAGQEIEAKSKQTSKTHYFLFIDKNDVDSMYNRIKINSILKTISYEYVYKDTNEKALSHYLTKADIEKILGNIEKYKDKKITIETTPPKQTQGEKSRAERMYIKKVIDFFDVKYGETKRERLFNLVIERKEKENQLIKKQKEARAEIKKINDNIKQYEKTTAAEIERLNESIFDIIQSDKKKQVSSKGISRQAGFPKFFDMLYAIVKTNKKREAGNERQKKYRARKNAESGVEKKKRGRPKQT